MTDTGVPRTFLTDDDTEYSNGLFGDFCNSLEICRETTGPHSLRKNGSLESGVLRAFKAGHIASL